MDEASRCSLCGADKGRLAEVVFLPYEGAPERSVTLCDGCLGAVASIHERRRANKAAGEP